MSTDQLRFLFVGLPKTGKSTFLAALDEAIETQQSSHGLKSGGFSSDRGYLQELRTAWLNGKEMPRTNPGEDNSVVELHAIDSASGRKIQLIMPDILGETYRHQCEQREWSAEYRDGLKSISGILLFVNCAQTAMHQPISSLFPMLVETQEGEPEPVKWETKYVARQAKLVELLQFILGKGQPPHPVRVALILSAWDVVKKAGAPLPQIPADYLAAEWPLLHQYLSTNGDRVTSKIFGVSARGGGEAETAALCALENPIDRIIVNSGEADSHDLTQPVCWLVNGGV